MTGVLDTSHQDKNDAAAAILALPPGRPLGLIFSDWMPCEINLIKEKSPIIEEGITCLGRGVYRFFIPNQVDIRGAITKEVLMDCLKMYVNVPNRMIEFKNKSDLQLLQNHGGLITTTTLPTGPMKEVKFSNEGYFNNQYGKVVVSRVSPQKIAEFPLGHFVEKLIIPNQVILEGLHKAKRLTQALNHFADVPGRTLIFQKRSIDVPKIGTVTKIKLPVGPIGVIFDEDCRLPMVANILPGSPAVKLNIPMCHYVESLLIPNQITVHKMGCISFEQILNQFSNVTGRILFLQESYQDIPNIGATVKIVLKPGSINLDLEFEETQDCVLVSNVLQSSQYKYPILGFYVERLIIPDKTELVGMDIATLLRTLQALPTTDTSFKRIQKRHCCQHERKADRRNS